MQKTILYALFLFLVTGLLFTACSKEEAEPESVNKVEVELETKVTEEAAVEEDASDYDDGTYSMDGSYVSPNGPETIGVTLTLEDDMITAVSIRKDATAEKSINYQSLFANGISALVVGKKLDEIGTFSSVNGSSLTPLAFEQALELIKAEADNEG